MDMQKVEMLISGGQAGADLGGLEAGKALGLRTGGFAPKGWRTEDGPMPSLGEEYGLVEHDSPSYPGRTMANVDAADVTIAFLLGPSVGTGKTIGYCRTGEWGYGDGWVKGSPCHRPVLVVSTKDVNAAVVQVREFLGLTEPKVVNVAGHRESSIPGIREFVVKVLKRALGSTTNE